MYEQYSKPDTVNLPDLVFIKFTIKTYKAVQEVLFHTNKNLFSNS